MNERDVTQSKNNNPVGKIFTMSCARALKESTHELEVLPKNVYMITFSSRLKEYALERGWTYETALAPSSTLFSIMQEKKKELNYDKPKVFNEFYRPRFIDELYNSPLSVEKLISLHKILKSGNNILLVCFCGDEDNCHRSIIKEILENSLQEV